MREVAEYVDESLIEKAQHGMLIRKEVLLSEQQVAVLDELLEAQALKRMRSDRFEVGLQLEEIVHSE